MRMPKFVQNLQMQMTNHHAEKQFCKPKKQWPKISKKNL